MATRTFTAVVTVTVENNRVKPEFSKEELIDVLHELVILDFDSEEYAAQVGDDEETYVGGVSIDWETLKET